MDDVKKDSRFSHISKDPRFHQLPSRERKVKIDKRFKSMFEDKKFKLKYTVDKRGRPVNTTTNENLRKFYELSDSGSDESDSDSNSDESDVSDAPEPQLQSVEEVGKKSKIQVKSKKFPTKLGEKEKTPKQNKGKHASTPEKITNTKDLKRSKNDAGKLKSSKLDSSKKGAGKSQTQTPSTSKTNVDHGGSSDSEDSGCEDEEDSVSDSESKEADDALVSAKRGLPVTGPDLARGEGLESSSEDDSDEDDLGDGFDHCWGEMDQGAVRVEDATSRLAVCNMDWDRIKAQDIMILVNSFKPQGGLILSVKIYPSEFGLERMKEEELHGPKELVEERLSSDEEDPLDGTEKSSGAQYHREKLRQYQLNRLRYYYAVIECDSKETGDAIYTECDGLEYESSSARLDLRFIPEDMTFDHEPKSVANELPDLATYKPSLFFNTALNQSKVSLTWDETDQDRLQVTMKKLKPGEIDEMDVQAYLASSSEEEEEEDADEDVTNESERLSKYRALLQGIEKSESSKGERRMEMEISWEPGLREATEDLVKKKAEGNDSTPWEQYLKKKKEKNKKKREGKAQETQKNSSDAEKDQEAFSDDDFPAGIDLNDPFFKEEMEKTKKTPKKEGKKKKKKGAKEEVSQEQAELQLLMEDDDDNHQHFNLKDIMQKEKLEKKKRKKKKKMKEMSKVEDAFKIDVNDTRFDAMYKSHHYNIDPSSHEFKKTKAMESIIHEKLKRKKQESLEGNKRDSGATKKVKLDPGSKTEDNKLSSLVKSIKMKTQQYQQRKDKGK